LDAIKHPRVGESSINNYGQHSTIVKYNSCKDVILLVDGTHHKRTQYKSFKDGTFKTPYSKSVYGVGFLGEGNHIAHLNGRDTRVYSIWNKMIKRCYSSKLHDKEPSYIGCRVCKEWMCFQTFANWYENNYYEINGEKSQIDKDILVKGNRIYSPDTCVFVNHHINSLFTRSNGKRGEFPIGVIKVGKRFQSKVLRKKKQTYLGTYDTLEEAFNAYKIGKENEIKRVADLYKHSIPKNLYDAMYEYRVSIDD